jgi:hypothetical protein
MEKKFFDNIKNILNCQKRKWFLKFLFGKEWLLFWLGECGRKRGCVVNIEKKGGGRKNGNKKTKKS